MTEKTRGRPKNPDKQSAAAKQKAYRDRQKELKANMLSIDDFNFYLQDFMSVEECRYHEATGEEKIKHFAALSALTRVQLFFEKLKK